MLRTKLVLFIVLILIVVACSSTETSLDVPQAPYDMTQVVKEVQTDVASTVIAIPSSTPVSTQTIRPPIVMTLYDDFEDERFDGSTSSVKWRSLFNSRCDVFQKDGRVVISNTPNGDYSSSSCDLISAVPYYVRYDKVGALSANLMLKKQNSETPLVFQTISFQTYDTKEIVWEASCGIRADETGTHFVFDVFPGDPSEQLFILGFQSAEYNTWYKVKMELDANTDTIKCFIDEELFYETTPPRLSEIEGADFFWSLQSFGDGDMYTEVWFDDVYRGR